MKRYIQSPSLKNLRLFPLFVVLLVVAAIPITVLIAQQQQNVHTLAAFDTSCPTGEQPQSLPGSTLIGAIPTQQMPIWCYNLTDVVPNTFVQGTNSWVDDFNHGTSMARFGTYPSSFQTNNTKGIMSTDGGYVIFNNIDSSGTRRTERWRHNNHWMTDITGGFLGGTTMRPDTSFHAENGKIVIEADVAAGELCYENNCDPFGGSVAWPEIDMSNASAPTGTVVDALYGYGYFGGNWAFGCRLHSTRHPICALQGINPSYGCPNHDTPDEDFCLGMRRWEIARTEEPTGVTVNTVDEETGGGGYWRQCVQTDPDTNCRDRFRMELTKNSLTLYVNGGKYLEVIVPPTTKIWDLPQGQLFPDSFFNSDVYPYFTDWTDRPDTGITYRFHWDRLAVNPKDANGSFLPPSAAPGFCLGQPGSVCPPTTITTAPTTVNQGPTNTPVPSVSQTPSNTPTPFPSATPTPISSPTPTPIVTGNSGGLVGNSNVESNIDSDSAGEAEAFSYVATGTGTANALKVFVDSNNGTQQLTAGIYTNASGVPGTLLGQGTINNPIGGTWNTISIPTVSITQGQTYWIAILSPAGGGTPFFRDQATGLGSSVSSSQTTLTSLPATFSTGVTWTTPSLSAYATTVSTGGGTTIPTATSTPKPSPTPTPVTTSTILLGNQKVVGGIDNNGAGEAEAFSYTALTNGTTSQANVYLDGNNQATKVTIGVYANTSTNNPGKLLGQATINFPKAGAWNSVSLSGVSLVQGNQYWIALLAPSGANTLWYRDRSPVSGEPHSRTNSTTGLSTMPAIWATRTVWNTAGVSAYLQ